MLAAVGLIDNKEKTAASNDQIKYAKTYLPKVAEA